MTQVENTMLIYDKYYPRYFNDYQETEVLSTIKSFIQIEHLNLLLKGGVSTGKSCLLKTIIKEYYKDIEPAVYKKNIMFINTIKEQGINYYRNEVKTFCQTCSMIKNKKKIIVIDDIDFINEQSQQVFRNCIDKYKNNVHFICSCTNIHKVIENLQSRLTIIQMSPLTKQIYHNIINKIKTNEGIDIEDDVQEFIINISNNNLKNIIVNIEKFKLYNKKITLEVVMKLCFDISYIILTDYTNCVLKNDLCDALNIIYSICEKGYSVIDILDSYYSFVKTTNVLSEEQKYAIIPYICKYIKMFYTIHEDNIELALFTNNLCKIVQNIQNVAY